MRAIERIPIFLENVDLTYLITTIWDFKQYIDEKEIDDLKKLIIKNNGKIEKHWKKYPDLRFTQVLVNLGLISNVPGYWYYQEEPSALLQQGVNFRDFILWGTSGLDRSKFERVLLRNMTFSHIENILKDFYDNKQNLHSTTLEAFEKEMEFNFKTIEINEGSNTTQQELFAI